MSLIKLLLLSLILSASAFAAPDFAPLKKATGDFIAVVQSLSTDIPNIHDAAGTAKALDSCATATSAVIDAVEDLARKNPELGGASQPPPEFVEMMKSFSTSQIKFQAIGMDLGRLCKQYADDPAVRAAMDKFQQVLVRMQKLGAPQ